MSAGKNAKVAPVNFSGNTRAQLFDIIRRRSMAFLQGYQHIGICGADRAGIAVGHVDAAVRQPDVVDDIVHLAGRDDLADGLLNKIAQTGSLLDAGAGRGADMHENWPELTVGKKFSPRNGASPKDRSTQREEPGNEGFGPAESEREQRPVAVAELREVVLEALLEPLEGIARTKGRSGGVPLRAVTLMAAAVHALACAANSSPSSEPRCGRG